MTSWPIFCGIAFPITATPISPIGTGWLPKGEPDPAALDRMFKAELKRRMRAAKRLKESGMNHAELVEVSLTEAEDAVAKAFSVMGNAGPGGPHLWHGAWGEYRKLGKLLCRLRTIRKRAAAWNHWTNRRSR